MSLATRCTHCGTIFKVVQDQLKVSEGWVRCGRCNEVFNALPTLFDLEREPPPQRPGAPQQEEARPTESMTLPPEPAGEADSEWPSTAAGLVAPSNDDFAALGERPLHQGGQPASATEFDLDTAIDRPVAAPAPTPASYSQHPLAAPEDPDLEPPTSQMPEDFSASRLPVTDEADALDSRYLMPSERTDRRPARAEFGGPDFADAEFPSDALGDEPGFEPTVASDAPPPLPGEARVTEADKPIKPPQEESRSRLSWRRRAAADKPSDTEEEQPAKPARAARQTKPAKDQPPEFMRQAARQAFWRSTGMRVTLSLLAVILTAGLGLQIAHLLRNQLAAYHPELKPLLTQWCELAQCQITPPLRIDALQVESATLVRTNSEGPDTYRLVVVVHNSAGIELAWPAIDLTLTDTDGSIVARKAFRPAEAQWSANTDGKSEPTPSAQPLPGAVPAQRSTALLWRLKAPELKLVGYTAELFYP